MNSMLAPRGLVGITPRPTSLSDESYMDFVQSIRKMVVQDMFPLVAAAGEAAYAQERAASPDQEDTTESVMQTFQQVPLARSFQRISRTQQEMMWRRSRETMLRVADAYLAEVDAAVQEGPARIETQDGFVTPGWARQEIHLQPGGYTDDPLSGVVYHMGTRAFYEGLNDHEEVHAELAQLHAAPADGRVERLLDVGCGIGQATLQLKQRFADAEVHGLDVALPVLQYACKLANDADQEIVFRQALAQDSGYADGYFDSIHSYLLWHETPADTFEPIIEEMFRILRPGGTFCVFDFPNSFGRTLPAAQRFLIEYDSLNNCEPYSLGYVACDFHGMLKRAGFEVEDGPATMNPFIQSTIATRPA